MQAIAGPSEWAAPRAPHAGRSPARTPQGLGLLISLGLHAAALALLLWWMAPWQPGTLPARPSVALIALQSAVPAAPSVASPYIPPPHHRPRPATAPTWRTAPAPAPPNPAVPVQEAAAPAAALPAPAPQGAAATVTGPPGSPSTAPGTAAGEPPTIAYLMAVSRLISAYLNCPHTHLRSTAVVHIRIARDGTVLDTGLVRSSGSQALDDEARDVVLRIRKFPEPPSAYVSAAGDFSIDQPISFVGS